MYLTGGTSAVLLGWRASTVDADLKLDPEPEGLFDAIRRVKDERSAPTIRRTRSRATSRCDDSW